MLNKMLFDTRMQHEGAIPSGDPIDLHRLFYDLELTDASLGRIAQLDIPDAVRITSTSLIKLRMPTDVLQIVVPTREFDVLGVKSPSEVPEQPLGQQAIDGCLNRLRNGILAREKRAPGEAERALWFSVENGLFRVAGRHALAGTADLSTAFDMTADYEDRAVAAVRLPGLPVVVNVSPASEAVRFPRAAVHAAYQAEGGFDRNTPGTIMARDGVVRDRQNPHIDLTQNRAGGPLSRQDQMARVLIRSLLVLAEYQG